MVRVWKGRRALGLPGERKLVPVPQKVSAMDTANAHTPGPSNSNSGNVFFQWTCPGTQWRMVRAILCLTAKTGERLETSSRFRNEGWLHQWQHSPPVEYDGWFKMPGKFITCRWSPKCITKGRSQMQKNTHSVSLMWEKEGKRILRYALFYKPQNPKSGAEETLVYLVSWTSIKTLWMDIWEMNGSSFLPSRGRGAELMGDSGRSFSQHVTLTLQLWSYLIFTWHWLCAQPVLRALYNNGS